MQAADALVSDHDTVGRHVEAVSLLNEMYASYMLEFLRVTVNERAISFAPYDAPPPPVVAPVAMFGELPMGALPAAS